MLGPLFLFLRTAVYVLTRVDTFSSGYRNSAFPRAKLTFWWVRVSIVAFSLLSVVFLEIILLLDLFDASAG